MRRKSKSYLYLFFKNFMLTLFVPLATILLLYLQAEYTVKDQILLSSQNTLNQFFRLVEATAEEMKEICVSISGSTECQTYAMYSVYQKNKATYQILEVKNLLRSLPGEKYRDIFVYYPYEDRIISGNYASLTADYYYDSYYAEKGDDFREEFHEILQCESKRPAFFSMNKDSQETFLCVAMKQFDYKDPKLSYVIILVLDPGYINGLMTGEGVKQEGTILMFDKEKKLILSGNGTDGFELEEYPGTAV